MGDLFGPLYDLSRYKAGAAMYVLKQWAVLAELHDDAGVGAVGTDPFELY